MNEKDERTAALYAYAAGVPSSLPDRNRYKTMVLEHRWGGHGEPVEFCPVCEEKS
jgi:hypothetical protein